MRRPPRLERIVQPRPISLSVVCADNAGRSSPCVCLRAAFAVSGQTINDSASYSGAWNELGCGLNRVSVGFTLGMSEGTDDDPATTCPANMQSEIDSMYSNCDGGADWETEKAAWKALADRKGCSGAAQAVPAALVAAAAVTSLMFSPS